MSAPENERWPQSTTNPALLMFANRTRRSRSPAPSESASVAPRRPLVCAGDGLVANILHRAAARRARKRNCAFPEHAGARLRPSTIDREPPSAGEVWDSSPAARVSALRFLPPIPGFTIRPAETNRAVNFGRELKLITGELYILAVSCHRRCRPRSRRASKARDLAPDLGHHLLERQRLQGHEGQRNHVVGQGPA